MIGPAVCNLFPVWLPLQFRMIHHNVPCLFAAITHRWVYCPSWAGGRCNLTPPRPLLTPFSPPPPDGKQAASRSVGLEVAGSQQETRIQTTPIIVTVRSNSRRPLISCPVSVRVCLLCVESDVIRGERERKVNGGTKIIYPRWFTAASAFFSQSYNFKHKDPKRIA